MTRATRMPSPESTERYSIASNLRYFHGKYLVVFRLVFSDPSHGNLVEMGFWQEKAYECLAGSELPLKNRKALCAWVARWGRLASGFGWGAR